MQTGNGLALFMTWGMTIAPFVLATWEEYYTGKLTLVSLFVRILCRRLRGAATLF
jgi:hypothetical protein